jgi:hypothetical protein
LKKIIITELVFMGVGGFNCAICGAPSGDKICIHCKAKNGC